MILQTMCGYRCSNHTAGREKLVNLPHDLSHYRCFGEALLTSSQVVDTSTILYVGIYAVAALVAIMCTIKSSRLR